MEYFISLAPQVVVWIQQVCLEVGKEQYYYNILKMEIIE